MESSINNPALSHLMKHLVIGQSLKTLNFSAFHWSPRGSLVSVGQHYVATRVVHLPKSTETSLIPNRTEADLITSYCSYARPAQPGPIRTRLCGPCIAVIAGFVLSSVWDISSATGIWRNSTTCILSKEMYACFCKPVALAANQF